MKLIFELIEAGNNVIWTNKKKQLEINLTTILKGNIIILCNLITYQKIICTQL